MDGPTISCADANHYTDIARLTGFGMQCPSRVHPDLRRDIYDNRPFYRARQRPGRLQFFVPGWVFTLSRSGWHAGELSGEVSGSRRAERFDFWKGLPAPVFPLTRRGILRRRYHPAELADFEPISKLLSERLSASLDRPTVNALSLVRNTSSFQALSIAERKVAEHALRGLRLPWTGMHGDLHLFNFLRRRGTEGYCIIDWEYFDPQGSFAYDFIDFFVAGAMIQQGGRWEDLLSERNNWLSAARHVSQVLDVNLQELVVFYLCLKTDIIVRHLNLSLKDPDGQGQRLIGILSGEVDRLASQRDC